MKIRLTLFAVVLAASAAWVIAQESLPGPGAPPELAKAPPTDARHYSYAIGLDIGSSFRNDGIELDLESVVAGLKDGLAKTDPKFSNELCEVALTRLTVARADALQKRNREYLATNARADGVQTTASGLQYKVIKSGSGASPTVEDTVVVHYRGQLIDGSEFDSSIGGDPATLPLKRVIPGWAEAMQKMKVGDKWQLVIPAELGYRDEGAEGLIPPYSTLIFEVELLGIAGK